MIRQLTDRTKAAFTERNARMTIRTLKRLLPVLMLALLTLAVLLPSVSAGALPTRNSPTDFAAIDAYVDAQMRDLRIPGLALAIVEGDRIVHLKGFGIAGPDGRAVTPQTPFQLASLVKPMTGVAIMQLVEAGKIDLDAPVQRYLPWFRVADEAASAQITVRHLLYHTSGLPGTLGMEYALSGDARSNALEMRARAALGTAQPAGRRVLGVLQRRLSGSRADHSGGQRAILRRVHARASLYAPADAADVYRLDGRPHPWRGEWLSVLVRRAGAGRASN
jgi:CubicO group peptidase (beta-lactamase class C family)